MRKMLSILLMLCATTIKALTQTVHNPQISSQELIGMEIPAGSLTEPTRGGRILSAEKNLSPEGRAYVDVKGIISSIDTLAPNIEWRMLLPDEWNGRSLQMGGGANNGSIPDVEGYSSMSSVRPVSAGYLTYADDSGHQADGNDATFAANEEALDNYIRKHLIKARMAMQYVAQQYYGKSPQYNYFAGCSTGGREALECATTYGKYYDGVFCSEPCSNFMLVRLWGAIMSKAVYDGYDVEKKPVPDGFIGQDTLKHIQQDAIAAYDELDGIKDGIVSNMFAARANKENILKQLTERYHLSKAQVNTLRVYEDGYRLPYQMANGMNSYQGYAALEGGWMAIGADPVPREPISPRYNVHHGGRSDGVFKYFVTKDPTWRLIDHDYIHPDKKLKKMILDASARYDANSPEFDDFLAHGGKLILFGGWNDMSISPWQLIAQYQGYVTKYGQQKVDKFCKFYLMPGVIHGWGISMDYLDWLDTWVSTGQYPPNPIYADMKATQGQMPMAEYPGWVKYVGGDPKVGSSYVIEK